MRKILDGIIDIKKWETAKIKVLFLLKETYGNLGGSYDLREFINDNGAWKHTYKPCGRIAYNLNNTFDNNTDYSNCLQSAAVINCIDDYGDHRHTPEKRLWELYDKTKNERVISMIKEIKPDIIICGNTYKVFSALNPQLHLPTIDKLSAFKIKDTNTFFDDIIISDSVHPSYRMKGIKMAERDEIIANNIKKLL